jgi:hypothetical protein
MIGYTVSIEGLVELEMDLNMSKDKTKNILRTAINNTAKKVESQMSQKAGQRYTLKEGRKGYHSINKIDKAKISKLYATITAASRPTDLKEYTVKPETYFPGSKGAPKWIKAKTLKKGGRLTSMALRKNAGGNADKYKAFVVKYASQHLALAQRVPGKHMDSKPNKELIRSLYATNKAKGEEVVYKKGIDSTVYSTLSEQIRITIPKYVK